MATTSHRELRVWQIAMEIATTSTSWLSGSRVKSSLA